MIEHAHREDRVKRVQRWKLLNAQRQQVRPLVAAQQLAHRLELAKEQLSRIDTYRQVCACAHHSPQVIAAAAANVENGTSG